MNRLAPSRRIAAFACATAVAVGAGGAASATLAYLFGVPSQHEFSHTASGDASGTLTVRAPAGGVDLTISPSPDDRLHVSASGTYRGGPPVVTVGESGAAVDIVCPEGQFWRCSLGVTVAVPSRADVTAEGVAGSITMTDLHGTVTATTTTGDVTIRRHHGPVRAQTAEGAVEIGAIAAPELSARTAYGSIRIDVDTPPDSVDVRNTIGDIEIGLPGGVAYHLETTVRDATAVTTAVAEDPASPHLVRIESSAGAVAVFPND
ncbi:hypothetical protein ABIC28_003213 [Rhodococcus sp. PvR044]|jgi:hypothetical protein|uniref:DUF4097 family beta strand repeat-containing protein n=1 Tax=Rhodococcus TaxID=1827 RepID=UPI001AE819FC|nr:MULTISPECIES: DUF4097 family beta strand repeat-containing protein [Rhodococcus]MBP1162288.1 hypothetical protein [Rhodococcus sp. PvR099]MCZ4554975.1 DUF4097 family beta strand repeat-containing protein [Rhodococcus maanshanensis]